MEEKNLSIEPLTKFKNQGDLAAGISDFRIGLPRPTPK
jgi:hypothetical protein